MIIDGILIAEKIRTELKNQIAKLDLKGIRPKLAVILCGNDPNSLAYVNQKLIVGKKIGIEVEVFKYNNLSKHRLEKIVNELNHNPDIHGIIIQRPFSISEKNYLDSLVDPKKDVDGFHPQSFYKPPIVRSIERILEEIFNNDKNRRFVLFSSWLKQKKVLVIGRGETAGKPIAKYLMKKGCKVYIAHSKTRDLKSLTIKSDVIIPCVGRPNIVRNNMLKNTLAVIGVGMHRVDNHLSADYNQDKICKKVRFYTTVPGGVGPVNVAYLMKNTVEAAILNTSGR